MNSETLFSFIIPAYNEEAYLSACIQSIRRSTENQSWNYEIIVVDNNSTDDTRSVARDEGATVVFEPKNQISRARNRGASEASGKYLIFVDADSQVNPNLLQSTQRALIDRNAVGGGALIEFQENVPEWVENSLNQWNRISRNWNLAAGSFLFCTSKAYHWAGGFSEQVYASEELLFSRELKRYGRFRHRPFIILENTRLQTSARKVDWYSYWTQILGLFMFILMPWAVYDRTLIQWYWYWRPDGDAN